MAAGVGGKLKTLEVRMTNQIKEAEIAATVCGKKVLNKVNTLYQKNPTLNKPARGD